MTIAPKRTQQLQQKSKTVHKEANNTSKNSNMSRSRTISKRIQFQPYFNHIHLHPQVVLGLPGSGCGTLASVLGEAPNTEAVDCNELLDKATGFALELIEGTLGVDSQDKWECSHQT